MGRTPLAAAVCSVVGLVLLAVAAAPHESFAEPRPPGFRDVHLDLLVQHEGNWYGVSILMFVLDGPDFEAEAEAAKDAMAARFPDAVRVDEGGAHAQWASAGWWWPERNVTWQYNPDGAPPELNGHAAAIGSGAATWSNAGADFTFSGGSESGAGTGACHGTLDDKNTVGWAPQTGSVLAVTCTWYELAGSPRAAIEFDMEIDPEWEWTTGSPVRVDLESVALHEFGHALGLAHSENPNAVMYATYSQGSLKRELTDDDLEGLYALYGATGQETPTPTATPTPTPTPTVTPTPTPTPAPEPPPLPLLPGANLSTWPGPTTSTSVLQPYADLIEIVYGWDPLTQSWQRWSPALPPWANSLERLQEGEAYWFIAKSSGTVVVTP